MNKMDAFRKLYEAEGNAQRAALLISYALVIQLTGWDGLRVGKSKWNGIDAAFAGAGIHPSEIEFRPGGANTGRTKEVTVKTRKMRTLWVVIGGFIIVIGVPWVLVKLQLRQDNLDHRLIQAVKNLNAPAVDRLLVEGANANVRYTDNPPPTLSALLERQMSRLQHRPDGQPDEEQKGLLPQILDNLNLGGQENVFDTIAVMLIRHGAAIDMRDRGQRTPLHRAASLGLHQTVRLLLSRGLDVNARSGIGVTPLMFADDESAELLVLHGADINAAAKGYTAVMTTLGRHHLKAATILIRHGADVHVIDPKGHSTLYSAYDMTIVGPEHAAIIRLLKDHGARLNKVDDEALARRIKK